MKTLVIGTGGREHALARGWPATRRQRGARGAGQPGDRRRRHAARRGSPRRPGGGGAGRLARHRPRRRRAGGAAGRRRRRRGAGGRDRGLRALGGGRAARGVQGVREGRHGRGRRADRPGLRLLHPRGGRGGARRARCAVRREGRRAGRRQGGGGHRLPRRGARPRGGVLRRRWAGRDRGVSRRPRGLAVRDHRRRHRLPDAAGPGLQADLRRGGGSQHRRHGCLHPAAVGAAGAGRRGHGHRPAAHRRRAGPPGHALLRAAVRRPGAHLARRAGHRVQRAVRRPRDPAAAGPARVAAGRAADGVRDRHARRRRRRRSSPTARPWAW